MKQLAGLYLLVGLLLSLVAVVQSQSYHGAPITDLPGLIQNSSFAQYSGYITVDDERNRNIFFWFAESQNDPKSDPLVLWLQGGPGCSGMLGLWTENGPWQLTEDLQVVANPNSWNRYANMIYIDSPSAYPQGTGFSYSTSPADATTGDNKTMADTYRFLQVFFAAFPQFLTNDFYVAGESYGGHYVPQLAWTILQNNDNASRDSSSSNNNNTYINLKGFLVGNAWTDDVIDTNSIPPFLYSHALCSLAVYEKVVSACGLGSIGNAAKEDPLLPGGGGNRGGGLVRSELFHDALDPIKYRLLQGAATDSKDECSAALIQMNREVGDDINQYDIYVPCLHVPNDVLGCVNYTAQQDYLNSANTMTALHISPSPPLRFPWQTCSTHLRFTQSWSSVVPIYPELVAKLGHILVYAGDVTYNVPFLGTQQWTSSLGLNVTEQYKNWKVNGQVAGYYTQYQEGLTYLTVKLAGHMVPTYQPQNALIMFQKFLAGEF